MDSTIIRTPLPPDPIPAKIFSAAYLGCQINVVPSFPCSLTADAKLRPFPFPWANSLMMA